MSPLVAALAWAPDLTADDIGTAHQEHVAVAADDELQNQGQKCMVHGSVLMCLQFGNPGFNGPEPGKDLLSVGSDVNVQLFKL